MKLNNTFKRELTNELKERFPSVNFRHENNYISVRWKETEDSNKPGLHWFGIRNGGKNQDQVLSTFGFVESAKSEFHKMIEKQVLDFSQKYLDKWVKDGNELF